MELIQWNSNEIQRNGPNILVTAVSVPKILSWMDYSWEAYHHWENSHVMISQWFPPGLKSFHIKEYKHYFVIFNSTWFILYVQKLY